MTNERKMRVDALITKLEECRKECDELYDEEDGQKHDLRTNGSVLAANTCWDNMTILVTAEDEIESAIFRLKEVEG
jgi:hypothetical protein